MNAKGLHRLLSSKQGWFLPAIGTPVPISAGSMSMRSMCSWIVGPLKFLHQHAECLFHFGSVPKTPIENLFFLNVFFGELKSYTCLFICLWFSNGVFCCTNLKTLWSLMVMWLCVEIPTNGCGFFSEALEKSTKCHSQKINQLRSEVKYLTIFLFQWKHLKNLKISQIDTYQIHKLPLLPLAQYTWSLPPPPFGSDPTCCSNLAAFPILSHQGHQKKSV